VSSTPWYQLCLGSRGICDIRSDQQPAACSSVCDPQTVIEPTCTRYFSQHRTVNELGKGWIALAEEHIQSAGNLAQCTSSVLCSLFKPVCGLLPLLSVGLAEGL